ncbi:MAG: hypothetical protein J3Q66DRAFT_262769, partial [Benniella sp.]
IKKWALEYLENGTISKSKTGCHTKLKSILSFEPIRREINNWLSSNENADVTPESFLDAVNNIVLKPYNITISLFTARRWLLGELGWVMSTRKVGLYYDGHEREDVVSYRKEFVERMANIEKRMIRQKGVLPAEADLEGKRPLIFYTHDESTFQSNDCKRRVYHPVNRAPFFKKSRGTPVMVSEFMSEVDGPITEVRKTRVVGKGHGGYFTGKDVAEQFEELINHHKKTYPDFDAVIAFDNACTHSCFAQDALKASKM